MLTCALIQLLPRSNILQGVASGAVTQSRLVPSFAPWPAPVLGLSSLCLLLCALPGDLSSDSTPVLAFALPTEFQRTFHTQLISLSRFTSQLHHLKLKELPKDNVRKMDLFLSLD